MSTSRCALKTLLKTSASKELTHIKAQNAFRADDEAVPGNKPSDSHVTLAKRST